MTWQDRAASALFVLSCLLVLLLIQTLGLPMVSPKLISVVRFL